MRASIPFSLISSNFISVNDLLSKPGKNGFVITNGNLRSNCYATIVSTGRTTTTTTTTAAPSWLAAFNSVYHPCNRTLKGWTRLISNINEQCRFRYASNECRNLTCTDDGRGLTACCQDDNGCNKCIGKKTILKWVSENSINFYSYF